MQFSITVESGINLPVISNKVKLKTSLSNQLNFIAGTITWFRVSRPRYILRNFSNLLI